MTDSAGIERWTVGDTVVIRNIARSDGGVTMAMPAIAIRDDHEMLALYVPVGTVAKDNYAIAESDRAAAVGTSLPSRARRYIDREWKAPTLRFYLPEQAFSVWLFFNSRGGIETWYGNLEAPYLRTPLGIDTRDHALDVVADRLGKWRWKDEDEFAKRLEAGIDTAEHQAAVRAAGRAFIARLEMRAAPFNGDWQNWQPPVAWTPRELPQSWAVDLDTGAKLC